MLSGPKEALVASASAWDRDFQWTYRENALPLLRKLAALPDLALTEAIPNSGVIAAYPSTWRRIATTWSDIYDSFLRSQQDRNNLRDGTLPGDQEFLALACLHSQVKWQKLHGSCNMQVDPKRMTWNSKQNSAVYGGHFGEPVEPIRAVHFGCNRNGQLDLPENALGGDEHRSWLRCCVEKAWAAAVASGLMSVLKPLSI
jgi:hypothetical protein